MFPSLDFVLPLSWVGAKRRPTQFASRKNAPGVDYSKILESSAFVANPDEGPAITPASEEVNEGDFNGFTSTALHTAVQNHIEAGSLEVPELSKPE